MNRSLSLRLLVGALLSLGLALVFLLLLYVTDLALGVWQRLQEAPAAFVAAYLGSVLVLAAGAGWVFWRLWRVPAGRRRRSKTAQEPPTPAEIEARIQAEEAQGGDVSAARWELLELASRRSTGAVYIALFGEVSTGKSSLVQALLPGARPSIDPRGGTTRDIRRYQWQAPDGVSVLLTDMPGVNAPAGALEDAAREEALRAHLVLYLTAGDLTRRQHAEVEALATLGKPVVVVLNKMDYYGGPQLEALRQRLAERVKHLHDVTVVAISAGGHREVIKIGPDGREEPLVQEIPPRIEPLLKALRRTLGEDLEGLEGRRDAAVHALAATKLEAAVAGERRQRADRLIGQYTRNAVIGALVAVSPGSDLVIQGYLGVGLVRALCETYQVDVREMDITRLLKLVSGRVRKTLPLILAVAGNALKAFPGIGTLAGGILHAVGYGLIFESLGHAVADSLAREGGFAPSPILRLFEEGLREDLETRAKRLVKLAMAEKSKTNTRARLTGPRDAP